MNPRNPQPGRPVVLAADDDTGVRTFLGFVLRQWGVDYHLAGSGIEAVELYRRHRSAITLVLLDVQMGPGLDGPDALRSIRSLDPEVRCWFMTADPYPYTEDDLLDLGADGVIRKPFHPASLRAALDAARARVRTVRSAERRTVGPSLSRDDRLGILHASWDALTQATSRQVAKRRWWIEEVRELCRQTRKHLARSM